MVVRVKGSKNLLSRQDLQWVSRVCFLLCVGRIVIIFLTHTRPYFHVSLVYLGFLNIHIMYVDGD